MSISILDKLGIVKGEDALLSLSKMCAAVDDEEIITSENENIFKFNTLCSNPQWKYDIGAIDDEYIWIGDDLIRRAPIFPFIRDLLQDAEEAKFKQWDIVRIIDKKTIREFGTTNRMNFERLFEFIGERLIIVNPVLNRSNNLWIEVSAKLWDGNITNIPQDLLVLARSKDIELHHYKRIKMSIKNEILRNKDQLVLAARDRYQLALRSYLDAESRLHDSMVWDITKEVDDVFKMRMCAKDEIMKLDMILSCDITEKNMVFITKCLTLEYDRKTYPIGAYRVVVDKPNRITRFHNLSINWDRYGRWKQHVHVWEDGSPCIGEFWPIIAKYIANRDDLWLAMTLIEFLTSYNPGSPVIGIERFYGEHSTDFAIAIKQEKDAKIEKPVANSELAEDILTKVDGLEDEWEDDEPLLF